ncbi:ethanolamine-phosphate cytidylyltransferase [Apostasia shenzhenica]|uniref:ethanolamine-phosphate cytidylyltransferase n=1 Tax=Apostasia shenzhenica TaxID=1088818 RepID=A0A2I0ABI7_9ASPA|nr:ethanolamine-phosphate cytidylyltransferase [Apostasia shenzhenica]
MGSVDFEKYNGIWDGVPQLLGLGGLMITAALLGISKCLFGGIGVQSFPWFWPDFGIFYQRKSKKRPIRVYMDGCFDLMHYGHANALRQAKALGDQLVVGVISDEEIIANKGPPVLSMEERLILVSGIKWVDEVITNAPYEITEQFMNTLFNEYKIDYIIHGDDPCLLLDGTDAYALAKRVGRYKQIKRTEGVSSTDIVGRILSSLRCTKLDSHGNSCNGKPGTNDGKIQDEASGPIKSQLSNFLPTSRRIMQFSNCKGPSPDSRVVYIDGAFDLFHAGHVEILRCARQLGDFLLVGIHSDQIVSQRGGSSPIMHLHERSLSVLACRYVDEVIIGAPWEVTHDMINTFNISLVVHGTVSESNSAVDEKDPYTIPKSMGIFKAIASPRTSTSSSIARRIVDNLEAYKRRNLRKKESEDRYYEEKKFVSDWSL